MSKFKVGDVVLFEGTGPEHIVVGFTSVGKTIIEYNNGRTVGTMINPDRYYLKPKEPIKSVRGIHYSNIGATLWDLSENKVTFFFDPETKKLIDVKMGDHS